MHIADGKVLVWCTIPVLHVTIFRGVYSTRSPRHHLQRVYSTRSPHYHLQRGVQYPLSTLPSSEGRDDLESFQLEISGFLKEMACPYSVLISGDIKDRLTKKDDCLKLLLFLSTELQALQILQKKKQKNSQLDKNSEICQEVQAVCDALGVPKSDTSDIPLLLSQVESKVKDILSKVQKNHVGKPLLKVDLSSEQAEKLERINDALCCEYECRRRMLMKRLDVTVQSFGWSDRAKAKTDNIARIYQPKRYALSPKTTVTLAHLLAAREDLSKIIRTSSGISREKTACAINKVSFLSAFVVVKSVNAF
ncbi:Protein FAM98B [Microtus ochrogaster]|uniref:Protein FAM98B n=1 Tax=Microtus ochrogaster TaxID=79684 RepID=A0A8J6GN33_MICOH|nr:Protein FAM98B [Microtus ochrogaster]